MSSIPWFSGLAVGMTTFLLMAFVLCASNFPGLTVGCEAGTLLMVDLAGFPMFVTLECVVPSTNEIER